MAISRPEVNITSLIQKCKEYKTLQELKTEDNLEHWLSMRNIINMHHICTSFYLNHLHYSESKERHHHFSSMKKDFLETSLPSVERIFVLHDKGSTLIKNNSYRIRAGYKASETLKSFPFSYTTLDCSASIEMMFFMTLYDFIRLVYGDEGDLIFDDLFGSQHSLEKRYIISNSGNYATEEKYDLLSPQQYFGACLLGVSLEKLIEYPESFLGMKLYINGHPEYLSKHRHGSAQGWNVIFCGLSEKKEPIFLGARGPGEGFYMTYQELMNILVDDYNKLPDFKSKSLLNKRATQKEMGGLDNYGAFFDLKKLMELTNLQKLKPSLTEFISKCNKSKYMQVENARIKDIDTFFKTPKKIIQEKIEPFSSFDTDIPKKYFSYKKYLVDEKKAVSIPHSKSEEVISSKKILTEAGEQKEERISAQKKSGSSASNLLRYGLYATVSLVSAIVIRGIVTSKNKM